MSDKPVAERLQVKGTRRLAVIGAPTAVDAAIGAARAAPTAADIVLLFVAHQAAMQSTLGALLPQLKPDALFWLAYPKLTSSMAGDLSRDVIHRLAPAYGLDTIGQIAIDQDWSAMRLKRV